MNEGFDTGIREWHRAVFTALADGGLDGLANAAGLCAESPEPSSQTSGLVEHALMECAFRLETARDLTRAAPLYQRLAEAPWADACHRTNAWYRLAIVRMEMGDIAESVDACQAAVAPGADSRFLAQARLLLVHLLKRQTRWEESLAELGRVLSDPTAQVPHLELLLQVTTCRARLGRTDAAQVPLELPPPGSSVSETTARLWMEAAFAVEESGDWRTAGAMYDRLLAQNGLPCDVLVNASYRCGLVAELRMDWEAGRRLYEAAITAPQCLPTVHKAAHQRLAELLLLLEEYELAASHFETLCANPELSDTERAALLLQRARCLWSLRDADRARSDLSACRALCPGSELEVRADLLLAEIFVQQGDQNAAAECCRRIAAHPGAEPLTKAAALAYAAQAQ